GRPAEERRATRQERSRPIIEALHAWLTAQLGRVSGKSGLAEAIRYGGSQASIDRSSSIPRSSAKRAKSAIEASTIRFALETTQVRRRERASQCRWRGSSRSLPRG